MQRARSALICHHDEPLDRFGLARWLASFTDLATVIVVHEPGRRLRQRVRREIQRIGFFRFFDVIAFRAYYQLFLSKPDGYWIEATLKGLCDRYPEIPTTCRVIDTASPNSPEVKELLLELRPDIVIARCKNILRKEIFEIPKIGTFVMHPGICPEYRNAHGCFWACVERDLERVGMTLLKVDSGIDTGPVYGYFHCDLDEVRESHTVIQNRVVFDNLDVLQAKFEQIFEGSAQRVDTKGHSSREWGQPWLTSYFRWKRAARRKAREDARNHIVVP